MMVTEVLDRVDGAVVVSTPQQVALLDARKSISMANHLKVPVLGMVENMSDPELFGEGEVEKAAQGLSVPYLGAIPLERQIIRLSDQGRTIVQDQPDNPAALAMDRLAGTILESLER